MARKTRREALLTKEHLLGAAETLFLNQGVSRTSLQQIAEAAGMTRGAVYWHFKDKVDILQAILDRAILPIDDIINAVIADPALTPEQKILNFVSKISALLTEDELFSNAIKIITYKVELVDEFLIMRDHYLWRFTYMRKIYSSLIEEAFNLRGLTPSQEELDLISCSIFSITTGLYHFWILVDDSIEFPKLARHAVSSYLQGLWAR